LDIPLSQPDITESEINSVCDVLRTPNLSLGPKHLEFEEKMAKYVGSKHAIAVNSGTSGLHLALKSAGISEGDKVITSPFSFIASANVILFEKATPIFVDIDPNTLNMDLDKTEEVLKNANRRKDKIKAILVVHVFGQPCDMNRIMQLSEKYNCIVIEDACEAIGAEVIKSHKSEVGSRRPRIKTQDSGLKTQKVGSFGKAGVFAFYPNKQMTTGEGGMIVTNDEQVARLCRSLRNQGRGEDGNWFAHERLGYNYRLSDINCALGIAQLERLEEMLARREKVARMYNQKLKGLKEVKIPYVSPNVKISWFVYVITLTEGLSEFRNQIINRLRQNGVGCSNYFAPIHLQPFYVKMFGYKKGDFPITEHISERTIALPFYNNLNEEQIDYIVKELKSAIGEATVK
jgi:perosamine synthetase